MPMETLLTFAIVLGVPLWLAAEELMHHFMDTRSGLESVEPPATATSTRRDARQPMETSASPVA
jgi:hypothetical protein